MAVEHVLAVLVVGADERLALQFGFFEVAGQVLLLHQGGQVGAVLVLGPEVLRVVGEALVRYINQGISLGSVNLPEVNMRSLTLEEPDHARVSQSAIFGFVREKQVPNTSKVIYVHRNVPGVLRKGTRYATRGFLNV